MSSSTRKDSLASSWTTNHTTLETGEEQGNSYRYDDRDEEHRLPPRPPRASAATSSIYPATALHRPLFLAARTLGVALALVLIALAVVAQRSIDRDKWMAPVLSPAIQSCFTHGADVYFIARRNVRSAPVQRLVYDGLLLTVGYAIANGFLVAFTLGDLRGTRPGSSAATACVALAILVCMFAEMLLHLGIGVAGGREFMRRRRARRLEA